MKVAVIVIGALGTIPKGLVKGQENLESWDHPDYSIIKIGLNTENIRETCCHSVSCEKPSANAGEKNSQDNNNNNNNNNKESEKKYKYLDLARELKKLWNMKVTIVPIVIGALGTVTKGLLKGLEDLEVSGRVETIQTTALRRTARILRRVLETWGDLLSLKLQWKTIS